MFEESIVGIRLEMLMYKCLHDSLPQQHVAAIPGIKLLHLVYNIMFIPFHIYIQLLKFEHHSSGSNYDLAGNHQRISLMKPKCNCEGGGEVMEGRGVLITLSTNLIALITPAWPARNISPKRIF